MADSHTKRIYHHENLLRELYRERDMSRSEIAERFGITDSALNRWIRKYNLKKKHEDEEVLRKLYDEKLLTIGEIAERFGVSRGTIRKRFNEFGIEKESSNTRWFLKQPATFSTYKNGYEVSQSKYEGVLDRVYIHRLLAVAKGHDPHEVFKGVDGNHVHHKNEIPWDNRPENIELLSMSAHRSHHAQDTIKHLYG